MAELHDFQPAGYYYTNTAYQTFEFSICAKCGQGKLGEPRPNERGVLGPYKIWNGRDTCPTEEELAEARACNAAIAETLRNARDAYDLERRAIAERHGIDPDVAERFYEERRAFGHEQGDD